MKKYEVVSPYVVFSVKAGAGRKEYALKKDDAVELPENDIAVRAMVRPPPNQRGGCDNCRTG